MNEQMGARKTCLFVFTEKTGSDAMDNYNKKYIIYAFSLLDNA